MTVFALAWLMVKIVLAVALLLAGGALAVLLVAGVARVLFTKTGFAVFAIGGMLFWFWYAVAK